MEKKQSQDSKILDTPLKGTLKNRHETWYPVKDS